MNEYPECEKLCEVSEQSQQIGEFLEWLKTKYTLCEFWTRKMLDDTKDGSNEGYYPDHKSIERLLAEYFGIDLDKVEKERSEISEILKSLQERN